MKMLIAVALIFFSLMLAYISTNDAINRFKIGLNGLDLINTDLLAMEVVLLVGIFAIGVLT